MQLYIWKYCSEYKRDIIQSCTLGFVIPPSFCDDGPCASTWHCRQVFVASRALVREGYETRTKCWSTLFAHMAGFAMISTLLKTEPTHANPQTRSKDLWHSGIMCSFSLKSVKSESANSLKFMDYDSMDRIIFNDSSFIRKHHPQERNYHGIIPCRTWKTKIDMLTFTVSLHTRIWHCLKAAKPPPISTSRSQKIGARKKLMD